MTVEDVKKYFGSTYKFAMITGMGHSNILYWAKKGFIPLLSQLRIERATDGKLKADFNHVDYDKDGN
jgi:hypothetical protein